MHRRSHCNRWTFQSTPSAFQMWWAQTASVHMYRYLHQNPETRHFHPWLCLLLGSVTAKKPKMFHCSLEHITESLMLSAAAIRFRHECRCIWAGNHSTQGHPCWNCVGSGLFFHKCIHHPWDRQQSQRVPCTVEKYCTAITTLVCQQSSVWLIFFMEETVMCHWYSWKIYYRLGFYFSFDVDYLMYCWGI